MKKSVKFGNQCESPDWIGTGVIQTSYDIVKAHGGEIRVESKEGEARPPARPGHSGGDDPVGRGTEFITQIPVRT